MIFVETKIKNMKFILVTISMLFTASLFSQVTLKSNGKVVKELSCDMTNVDMTLTIPVEAQNYDKLLVLVERFPSEEYNEISLDYKWSNYGSKGYNQVYQKAEVLSKSSLTFKLADEENDGLSNWEREYKLSDFCDDKFRYYENVYYRIRYSGATHAGWKWENEKQVKTYEWTVIKYDYFKLTVGPIDPYVYNTTGNLGVPRAILLKGDVSASDADNSVQLKVYAEKEGEVNMGEAPSESISNGVTIRIAEFTSSNKATIISSIEADIIRRSNYYYRNSLKPQGPFFFMHDKDRVIHMGAILGAKVGGEEKKSKSKFAAITGKLASAYGVGGVNTDKALEDIQNMIDNSSQYFNWTKETLNGLEYDILEIAIYDKSQTQLDSKKNPELKPNEKENSKKLKYYVLQKGDTVYVIGMAQTGSSMQLDEAKEIWTSFPNSVKIK
jgi:hypothetical protein